MATTTLKMRTLALACAALAVGAASAQTQRIESLAGKALPAFKTKDAAGKPFTQANLKGKVVLIDFWATWCGPCKKASPTMQALWTKYSKQGLVVLGANYQDSMAAAKKYTKEHGYTYPQVVGDPMGETWGVQGIPAFVFVDRKGVVRQVETGFGPSSAAEFEATVKKLLAAK